MSIYYEGAEVLDTTTQNGGSIKSIVFGRKDWKSNPRALFALATEAAKWSEVLSEVIEKAGLVKIEKQLSPTLALLLTHDLLLAKKGLALPTKHGLYAAIARNKARLSAEFTKLRLRRGFASFEALKARVDAEAGGEDHVVLDDGTQRLVHPRWIRINTLRTPLKAQLSTTFAEFQKTTALSDITNPALDTGNLVYIDEHIPDLVAIPPSTDITTTAAYKSGALILQDKASCFPAYLLDPASTNEGDIIDACAAPGNKTTHLAALTSSPPYHANNKDTTSYRKVMACERDPTRSITLSKMVKLAGANDVVRIKANQDFLRLNPEASEFANVKAVLLDPSCSGSGIIGRDEATVRVHLPKMDGDDEEATYKGKKRKRKPLKSDAALEPKQLLPATDAEEEIPTAVDSQSKTQLQARLQALSSFQLRLLEHAMAFPAVKWITYSTCSLYAEENEHVIVKALLSDIARRRGWRVLKRDEQVEGLRKWSRRGDLGSVREQLAEVEDADFDVNAEIVADACIRCEKGGEEGTMGFFVCGFVREDGAVLNGGNRERSSADEKSVTASDDISSDEDEWSGFDD